MAIRDKAAAFLSQLGPAVTAAAGNSAEQIKSFAVHAGQSLSGLGPIQKPNFDVNAPMSLLGTIGQAAGEVIAGKPGGLTAVVQPRFRKGAGGAYVPDTSRGGIPYVGALATELPTTGLLGSVGMAPMANKMQAALLNPNTRAMLGAGVIGAGALGLAAAAGIGYMQNQRRKERIAGQKLGAQLGVAMPPQY